MRAMKGSHGEERGATPEAAVRGKVGPAGPAGPAGGPCGREPKEPGRWPRLSQPLGVYSLLGRRARTGPKFARALWAVRLSSPSG